MRDLAQIENMIGSLASMGAGAMMSAVAKGCEDEDVARLSGWIDHLSALAEGAARRADTAEAEALQARAQLVFAEKQIHLLREELDDREWQRSDVANALIAQRRDNA